MEFLKSCTEDLLRLVGRDGDVVTIRVTEDGQALDIRDNHSPDASAAPTVDPSLTEEPLPEEQSEGKL